MLKTLSRLSEHEFTVIVTKAAKEMWPDMTGPARFTKLFIEDSEQGRAVRVM
jgi:hypothetical protein